MNYCYINSCGFPYDCGCPYYVPEIGGCLSENPELECDDYAAFDEDEEIDMHALNP